MLLLLLYSCKWKQEKRSISLVENQGIIRSKKYDFCNERIIAKCSKRKQEVENKRWGRNYRGHSGGDSQNTEMVVSKSEIEGEREKSKEQQH